MVQRHIFLNLAITLRLIDIKFNILEWSIRADELVIMLKFTHQIWIPMV